MTGKNIVAFIAALLLAGGSVLIVAQNPSATPNSQRGTHTTQSQSDDQARREGERRFQQNCGRCHRAPQTLSSRVAPAVLMHMRVRATLTAEDERLILKFMNP